VAAWGGGLISFKTEFLLLLPLQNRFLQTKKNKTTK
jgi:hypothetical protein